MQKAILSFFGCGYLPVAPGSWGSLGAAGVYLLIVCLTGDRGFAVDFLLAALVMLASAACLALAPQAVRSSGKRDPSFVVIDEAAGMWLALLLLPHGTFKAAIMVAAVQFVLFRIADIVKPPPARQLEALGDGWGILTDDLAAGLYANIVGQVIFRSVLPAC